MLSKLLTTARALLDRASQAEEPEPQQTAVASTLADAMVTTRRQSGKNVIDRSNDDDSVRIEASGSSRKRQNLSSHSEVSNLIDEEDVGTPAVKRQKILPVRAKDDDKMPNKKSRVVVEIPISPFGLEHGGQLNGNRKQPVKRIGTAEDVEEVAASDAHLSRLEIPDSDSDDKDSEVAEVAEESDLDISSPGQKKPTNDQISIASAAATSAVPGFPNPKHKRFDSEESEVLPFSTALEKAESEDESSDDDAPEVVGALEALEQARMKVREAAKAVEERESSIRKKRKQRDAILKQQASKKRQRGALAAEFNEAAAVEISHLDYPLDALQSVDSNDQDDNEAKGVAAKVPALKTRPSTTLPEFLPEEYLQDEESDESLTLDPIQRSMKLQKMKFTGRIEKRPKSYRKGSTTYKVAEIRSTKMAPKSSFNARSVKESWLQGRSGSSRKSFTSGFFKAK